MLLKPKKQGGPAHTSRRRTIRDRHCPCCGREADFFWTCPCGFRMCQACMEENAWGLTCNSVTWTCPDCGRQRSY